MKKLMSAFVFLLGATLAFGAPSPNAGDNPGNRSAKGSGVPIFVTGKLGKMSKPSDAPGFMASQKALLHAEGNEAFLVKHSKKDELGQSHVRL